MNSNLEAEVYALSRSLEQVTTAHAPCAAEILSLRRQTEEMERETKLLEKERGDSGKAREVERDLNQVYQPSFFLPLLTLDTCVTLRIKLSTGEDCHTRGENPRARGRNCVS